MSIEAVALALHHSKASGTTKLVLIGIANHLGDGGAWPSVETLSRYANTSTRQVQRSIQELLGLGEVEVYLQGGNGRMAGYRTNRYEIRLVCPATCDGSVNHKVARGATSASLKGRLVRHPRGDVDVTLGATPASRKPYNKPSGKPSNKPLDQNKFDHADFEDFWNRYPRRVGKAAASKTFSKIIDSEIDPKTIVEAAERLASDPNLPVTQFIPYPTTWLNRQGWEDEPYPVRELSAEEKAEKLRLSRSKQMDSDKVTTKKIIEETRLAEELAKANPAKKCEHDRIAVICKACLRSKKSNLQ